MKELTQVDTLEVFCSKLVEGPFKDGMINSMNRVNARIAEIGWPAVYAENEAEKEKILKRGQQEQDAKHSKELILQRLKDSGLGKKFFSRTFLTFEATESNDAAFTACMEIASGKRHRGIVISGANGIGKTHLAGAIVNACASKGRKVSFGNIVDIASEVKDSFKTGTAKVFAKLMDCEVLIIDDLGAEHSRHDNTWSEELLYKIINTAYESDKILVITTNIHNKRFSQEYGDRLTSRIEEMTDWIEYIDHDRRRAANSDYQEAPANDPWGM